MRVRYCGMIGGVGGFVLFGVIRGVLRYTPIRNQLRPISLTFSSLRTVDAGLDTYGKQQLLPRPDRSSRASAPTASVRDRINALDITKTSRDTSRAVGKNSRRNLAGYNILKVPEQLANLFQETKVRY